ALWSNLSSVSPPPGGCSVPSRTLGGGPALTSRNDLPPSTDPSHMLRCVPVPVGPLTNTRPRGSTPMSGSRDVWIGSTSVGVENAMLAAPAWMGEVAIAIAPTAISNTERSAILRNQRIVYPPASCRLDFDRHAGISMTLAAARCSHARAPGEPHPPRLNAKPAFPMIERGP